MILVKYDQKLFCQKTSNPSLLGRYNGPLYRADAVPLGNSGGSVELEMFSFRQAVMLVEVREYGGAGSDKFLQASHTSKP